MRVTVLQAFDSHPAGRIVDLPDRQAQRVIRTGYAVPAPKKKGGRKP